MQDKTTFDPQVDDQVNYTIYTDVLPGTVIERSPKSVTVQLDKYELADESNLKFHVGGYAAHVTGKQVYNFTRDTEGQIVKFTLRKSGQWKRVGVRTNERGAYLSNGWRAYYDYGF